MAVSSLRRALTNPKFPTCHSQLFFSFATSSSSNVSPPFPSFRAAKNAIIAESNPSKLAELFLYQASNFPTFIRHRPIYHLAIRKLSRANRLDLVEQIVENQIPKGSSISEGFLLRLIMLYSNAGMTDHAVRLFYDLAPQFRESEKPLCAILTTLLNNSEFGKLHQVFDEVKNNGLFSPSVKAYNLKLSAFCEEKQIEMAKEMLRGKMEKENGVVPDIHSYNVVLGTYLKNKNWGGFDAMVKEVLRKGLEPHVRTYNYRIVRLCEDKECARAKKLLDEMVGKGIKPNVACYNAIIHGFCKVGDLESAKMALNKMLSDKFVKPCSLTYYTMFTHMVQEGEFNSALEMCKEILRRKWIPPFEAMEGLVKGLDGMSKKDEAKQLVEKMKKKLKGPAVESWGKIESVLPLKEETPLAIFA